MLGRSAGSSPHRFGACSGILLALACGGGESGDARRPSAVLAQVSENISTVVNVRWTTEQASIGYIEYGPTEAMELNTPLEAEATKRHARSLLGLTADTVYHYRVVTWDGDDAAASKRSRPSAPGIFRWECLL